MAMLLRLAAALPLAEGLRALAGVNVGLRVGGRAAASTIATTPFVRATAVQMADPLHDLSDANFVNLVVRERRKPVVVAFEVDAEQPLLTALHEKGQIVVYRAAFENCSRFLAWLNTNGLFLTDLPAMIVFADGRPLGLLAGGGESDGLRAMWSGVSRILARHQIAAKQGARPALRGFDQHAHNFYINVERRHMLTAMSADREQ